MWIIADAFTNAMVLAGVVLLMLFLFRRFNRRNTARHLPASSSRPESTTAASSLPRSADSPNNSMQWQVEMHDMATSMKGELDSKMRLLQLLIGQARAEAERLEQLLAECESRQPRQP